MKILNIEVASLIKYIQLIIIFFDSFVVYFFTGAFPVNLFLFLGLHFYPATPPTGW